MHYRGQTKAAHERVSSKTGVLITNLGTPSAPTKQALKPYLREFLSDPRVVELPKWKWWPILYGIILNVRPAKSAKLYASVWTEKGSPLMTISLEQRDALQKQLGDEYVVRLGMRYGQPSIASELQSFQDQGINKLIVLPLYPQYSAPTTGSTFDALSKEIAGWRWMPNLHFINTYHDHDLYIDALCQSIERHREAHGEPERWVFSYHGMPQRYLESGDPYFCLCQKTTRLVAEKLNLDKEAYITSFQSLFGREEWLKPYTDATLEQLGRDGVKHIAVLCPGFSADCLETIEEIGEENREVFTKAGGQTYHYIPALNVEPAHIAMMEALVKNRT